MPRIMAKDVRGAVGGLGRWDNRSLLYDKFSSIPESRRDTKSKHDALDALCLATEINLGCEARRDFAERLKDAGLKVVSFRATLASRLIIGQAGGVIENAGLYLDRHFGMPYIPGTALKGICLRAARESQASEDEITEVFGEQDRRADARRGCVSFLAAYPVAAARIELDIVTCHHPDYYRGDAGHRNAPDNESPIPVQFPTVAPGIDFMFSVAALSSQVPAEKVEKAASWLRAGLTERGVGAKTAAGYGWFEYDVQAELQRKEEAGAAAAADAARRAAEAQEKARFAALSPVDRGVEVISQLGDEDFSHFVQTLAEKTREEQVACIRILARQRKDRWKTWTKKGKPFVEKVRAIAKELGEALP